MFRGRKATLRILLLVWLNPILFAARGWSGQEDWIHRASVYMPSPPYEPFEVELIGSSHGHLFGTASYRDYRNERLPVTINGSVDDLGRFWPDTSAAVASDFDGPWESIKQSAQGGYRAIFTVTVSSPNIMLYLNLDNFRPYVEKKRFARLLLKNGSAATFRLDDLAGPQAEAKKKVALGSAEWDRQMVFGGPPDPIISRPFVVVSVRGGLTESRQFAATSMHLQRY